MTIHKIEAIRSLFKGSYDKATEDKIVWKDGHETTDEENSQIDAEFSRLQTEYDAQAYARNRQARYNAELPMGDQFDAILKGFNQLRFDGQDLPADLDEVIGIWLGIKSAIPKE